MKSSEKIIRDLLSNAGVMIDGPNPWDIQVHNPRFYKRVLSQSVLGLGESYMDGWWDCESIDEMIAKIARTRMHKKIRGDWRTVFHVLRAKIFNMQNAKRAFMVGEKHYDVGNDLYRLMLDSRMNYTCAYWKNAKTLDEAQEAKLDLVCRKVGLKPGMKVLELGCGWGSFAKFAAEKYGAEIEGVTVSRAQVELGRELCRGLPVTLHLKDYREMQGRYDAVVSIGIMEHVGYKNYRLYMETADRCLKEGGTAFVHTIGGNTSTLQANEWIHRYIFPNGMIPSIAQLGCAMEGLFVMEDWHNFGPDYDRTLMAWHDNFVKSWPRISEKYGERFYRMWKFYLLLCAGGFRARDMQLWQIVLTREGTEQPECRLG